jgi:hypothetical protein
MTGGMRDLTIDELDAVSGGRVHTEVKKQTMIDMKNGILVIGTVSIDGGSALPFAKWIPG